MAELNFLYWNNTGGYQDVSTDSDSTTLGGLTMGGNIDMNSAGKIVGLNDGTAAGDALAYGQAGNLSSLTIGSGGDITVSGGGELTGLPATPGSSDAAASKAYVDAVAEGLDPKESVVAATTAAGTLASDFENGDTIDGVVLSTGDRILIKNQSTGTENGIYTVNASGAPTRASDLDTGDGAAAAYCWVQEGTDNADQGFLCTNNTGSDVVGTDALVFVQFSGLGQVTAGTGCSKDGNTLNVGGGDGIVANADNVAVDLATNPGLQFTSNKLDLLLKSSAELAKDASGLYIVGVPAQFQIGGVATGATVTAANLDDVTDGSSADSLHTHTNTSVTVTHASTTGQTTDDHHPQLHTVASHSDTTATGAELDELTDGSTTTLHNHAGVTEAERVENSTVALEILAKADPVYQGATADKVGKALANTDSKARVLGLAKAAAAADAAVEIVSEGLFTGALTGATAGDEYWLDAAGGLVVNPPAGNVRSVFIGVAKNATDLWLQIQDHGKKPA